MTGGGPLSGRRLLVTRAEHQARELVELIEARGGQAISVPVMRMEPLVAPDRCRRLGEEIVRGEWDDLVFTSANAVRLVLPRSPGRLGPRIFAIGSGTAAAVEERGWPVEALPESFVAESLAETLLNRGVAGRRMLLPRAQGARTVLPELLAGAGARLELLELYRMAPELGSRSRLNRALADPGLDCVIFASGSAVACFMELRVGPPLPAGLAVACIGPITAAAAREAGIEPEIVADRHSIPGLVAALESHLGPGPENGGRNELP